MSLRLAFPLITAGLLLAGSFVGKDASTPTVRHESAPILAIETMPARPTLVADVAELGQAAREKGRLESIHAFGDLGNPARSVMVTTYPSVQAAEKTALALDGSAAAKWLSASASKGGREVSFYRCLRRTTYSKDEVGHVEVVVYRTKVGTTKVDNLKLFDAAEAGFKKLGAGLLGHSMWIAPDGTWVHLVHWRSAADYAKGSKALMAKPGVSSWIRSLDFKRFSVLRGDVVASLR